MALIKCTECGKKISNKAATCPNCGCPINSAKGMSGTSGPTTITSPTKKKKGRGCLIAFIGFIVVTAFVGNLASKNQNADKTNKPAVIAGFQDSEMTETVKQAASSALKSCGIETIKSVTHDELLDNAHLEGEKGYRVASGDLKNIILYINPDESVHFVKYADNILFENGEVKAPITDFVFTSMEMLNLQAACQDAVTKVLKSPSTAKFPNINNWSFSKQNNEIIIQSYVDADNSFGANLRSEFQFILNAADHTVKSFIFDGEELMQ